jgi:hypothetical protein
MSSSKVSNSFKVIGWEAVVRVQANVITVNHKEVFCSETFEELRKDFGNGYHCPEFYRWCVEHKLPRPASTACVIFEKLDADDRFPDWRNV